MAKTKTKKRESRKPERTDSQVSVLLRAITTGKSTETAAKGTRIFSQGEKSDAVYFIENGKVKISVVSPRGKEAVLVILGTHDFFGEGCLVGQPLRISTAIALEASTLFSRLLAGAITMIFFTYAFVNMGMVSGILPVVGVPLPFISYGGTAMVTLGLGLGILMSIARAKRLVQS